MAGSAVGSVPSASVSSLSSELSRSSSTPPEWMSGNVFAFGLHSSYGAFSNDSAAPPLLSLPSTSAPQPHSPPLSVAANRAANSSSNGANPLALLHSGSSATPHMSTALQHPHPPPHHLQHVPGMDAMPSHSSAASPPSSASPASWLPSQASLDFSHLSLPPSSSPSSPLLHLSQANLPSPFSSTFLFSHPPPSSTSSSPSQAPSPHSGHPSDSSSSSDPTLSSLPLDYHPYYYLSSLPPMSLSSPGFDPFALPLPLYLSNAAAPSRPGLNASICKFYAAGHCARGDQCNYAHVRADGTTLHAGHMRGGGPGMGGMRGGRGRGEMRGGERGRGRAGMRGGGYRGQRMGEEPQSSFPHSFQAQPFLSPHSLHKEGGLQPHPGQMGGSANPLQSPLSPALLPLHPLADPSLLLQSPPFAPLEYSMFSPWPPAGELLRLGQPPRSGLLRFTRGAAGPSVLAG